MCDTMNVTLYTVSVLEIYCFISQYDFFLYNLRVESFIMNVMLYMRTPLFLNLINLIRIFLGIGLIMNM